MKNTKIRSGAVMKQPTQQGDRQYIPDNSISTSKVQDLAITPAKMSGAAQAGLNPKNFLLNSDMAIAQRGTSLAGIGTGQYLMDRFQYEKNGAMVHTVSQDTDVPTFAQANYLFQNSMRFNLTTPDTSIAAGEYTFFGQKVEGYNWAQLAQRDFTLSFWVKATTPGIYCIAARNGSQNISYVAEYTVNNANAWEYKTIVIPASPSAGSWNYSNGIGIHITWCLAVGSTFQTTAGSWQNGNFLGTVNQVNAVNTGSTDFRVTGTMLNVGTSAAAFSLHGGSYQRELAACQRFYQKSYEIETPQGSNTQIGIHIGPAENTANQGSFVPFLVTMRAVPAMSFWDQVGNASRLTAFNTAATLSHNIVSGAAISTASKRGWTNSAAPQTTCSGYMMHWVADAEL